MNELSKVGEQATKGLGVDARRGQGAEVGQSSVPKHPQAIDPLAVEIEGGTCGAERQPDEEPNQSRTGPYEGARKSDVTDIEGIEIDKGPSQGDEIAARERAIKRHIATATYSAE